MQGRPNQPSRAHNLENALASALAAGLCGIKPEIIAKALAGFHGIAHRIEKVEVINGVTFIMTQGTTPTLP